MPVVPRVSTPTVQERVVSQPLAPNVDVSSGLKNLGGAFDAAAQTGLKIKERLDTTAAEDAMVQFERSKNDIFFNPDSGYFNTQGRNAVEGADAADKALEKLLRTQAEAIKSPQARTMFERAAAARLQRDRQSIMVHASKGQRVYESATLAAMQENAIENGALYWNNAEELTVARVSGRQAVIDQARVDGLEGEALAEKLQTFESTFASGAIKAALDARDIAAAEKLLEKFDKSLEGPDKNSVTRLVTAERDKLYVMERTDAILSSGETLAEMKPLIDAETDPVKRKAIRTEVTNEFNMRKKMRQEAIDARYDELGTHIFTGQVRVRDISVEDAELLGASKISALQRFENEMMKGRQIVTDEAVKNQLDSLLPAELAKIDPFDYRSRLSDNDFSALQTRWRAAKKGTEDPESSFGRTKALALSQTVSQIFGKKPKPEQVNAFSRLVREQAEFEKVSTLSQYEDLLAKLAGKAVIDRSRFIPGTTDYTLKDIPADYHSEIAEELRRVGQPVTVPNMYQLYRIAKEEGVFK